MPESLEQEKNETGELDFGTAQQRETDTIHGAVPHAREGIGWIAEAAMGLITSLFGGRSAGGEQAPSKTEDEAAPEAENEEE